MMIVHCDKFRLKRRVIRPALPQKTSLREKPHKSKIYMFLSRKFQLSRSDWCEFYVDTAWGNMDVCYEGKLKTVTLNVLKSRSFSMSSWQTEGISWLGKSEQLKSMRDFTTLNVQLVMKKLNSHFIHDWVTAGMQLRPSQPRQEEGEGFEDRRKYETKEKLQQYTRLVKCLSANNLGCISASTNSSHISEC